jgi:hypothetical protein
MKNAKEKAGEKKDSRIKVCLKFNRDSGWCFYRLVDGYRETLPFSTEAEALRWVSGKSEYSLEG